MATIYYHPTPAETYQDLLDLSRDARDLYLWMGLGEKQERNGLMMFHQRLVSVLGLARPLPEVLAELVDAEMIAVSDVGRRRYVVALLSHVEWMAPVRDGAMLIRWRKDAETVPECAAKSAWVALVSRKCAETHVPVRGGRNGGVTEGSQGGDPKEKKPKETKGNETKDLASASPAPKKRKPTAAQKPPTPDEVQAYSADYGDSKRLMVSTDLGQRFCDYYESKGWKVGKTPMKSWQAAVRGWINRDKTPLRPGATNPRPGQRVRNVPPANNFGR